jgi:hypothetical protein
VKRASAAFAGLNLLSAIGMREFGNLILLGSKPLQTAKAEVWACKILPGWLGKNNNIGFLQNMAHIHIKLLFMHMSRL